MSPHDLALLGGRVLLADWSIDQLNVGVRDGTIITLAREPIDAERVLDVSGLMVVPGLVDEHFHAFRGYGWETHEVATRAAAKGGITSVVDMPLDKPATLTTALLDAKLEGISDECYVDYAMFGGYLDEQPDEIGALARAGVVALKLFTGGVAPPGMFPGADTGAILDCMRRAAAEGLTVVVHCENAEIVDHETARLRASGRTDPGAWDEARPWFSELEAVQRVALMAEVTGCRVVIAHVTAPQSVEFVQAARARGVDVWIETCPHYLCITIDEMARDTRLKWNPPSRDRASVERLWELVAGGAVHTIGSDHAPLAKIPGADIWEQLPGAGNGLETMLPIVATEALRRGIPLPRVIEMMSATPARLFGLSPRKGAIALGADADFAVLETSRSRTLDAGELEYYEQEKWSPYDGREVSVYPVHTILRGKVIVENGVVTGDAGYGRQLTRVVDA